MSIDVINQSPELLKKWVESARAQEKQYAFEHPDSLIPAFVNELRELGFSFEISNQALSFMPKHKRSILPIAIRYYQRAKEQTNHSEQDYFLNFFHFKGLDEVVPMLIEDYYAPTTPDLTRWFISDCLYQIRSAKYIDAYLQMISNPAFGSNRQMIVLLIGKLKAEKGVPLLIQLLEDENVRLQAICALGDFKEEAFRCYFERFSDSKHPGLRKYAKEAIKKLDRTAK